MRYEHSLSKWHLRTDTGDEYTALMLILATGNPEPNWPCPIERACLQHEGNLLIKSPWTGSWLHDCDPKKRSSDWGWFNSNGYGLCVGQGWASREYPSSNAVRHSAASADRLGSAEAIKWPDDISSASALSDLWQVI